MNTNKFNQGSALLTALVIVSLVSILASAMSVRLARDIKRTELIITSDRINLAGKAVHLWALDYLLTKKTIHSPDNNALIAVFSNHSAENAITISGRIVDLQAQFNINNTSDKKYLPTATRLLRSLTFSEENASRFIRALQNWQARSILGKGDTSYDDYYNKQTPPYLSAHQLLTSVSELRLLYTINQNRYKALLPFITVLPEASPINIRSCSKKVLMALCPSVSDNEAEAIISARKNPNFEEESERLLKKCARPDGSTTLESTYFLSVAHAQHPLLEHDSYVLYKRTKNKNKTVDVEVIASGLGRSP